MKNTNKTTLAGRHSRSAAVKITNRPPPAPVEWPFLERRRTDRRQQDRRSPKSAVNVLSASPLCTNREEQVLLLVVQGLTNKEIAKRLRIAEDTVKKHLQHVYSKLGIRRRTLLIVEQVGRLQRASSPGKKSD